MKHFYIVLIFLQASYSFSQNSLKELGFREFSLGFEGDKVDFVVKSKKGDELKPKPIFLFCQGSLPRPMAVKYKKQVSFFAIPFKIPENILNDYHIVIISKPGIPVQADSTALGNNYTYLNPDGKVPELYYKCYFSDYYVHRNIFVLENLLKEKWVKKGKLVVAGHSQGSTVAALISERFEKITHLIHSGGNPFGRIMQMVAQRRAHEKAEDSTAKESIFQFWEEVVQNKNSLDSPNGGDPGKSTYDFSQNIINSLLNLEIPVLISYGTKDRGTLFNDYLRIEVIREGKKNFEFQSYFGAEHNYFPVLEDGSINYNDFQWDKVAENWSRWLDEN